MKIHASSSRDRALTLLEFIVVLFSLSILLIVLLPALSAPRLRNAMGCINQLKETGVAFHVWQGDHRDKFPMNLSVTNGGVAELAATGNAEAIFQVLSNELHRTRILVCPADKNRLPAATFRSLLPKNVSYFAAVDVREDNPQQVLAGDDNLAVRGIRVKSGLLTVSNNVSVFWTADRHRLRGHLVMADGGVVTASNFAPNGTNAVTATNGNSYRLAIP